MPADNNLVVGAISQYLSSEQKIDLVQSFASKLTTDSNSVDVLCEVIKFISEEETAKVIPDVYAYCLQNVKEQRNLDLVLKLIQRFGVGLSEKLINYAVSTLMEYIDSSMVLFDASFGDIAEKYKFLDLNQVKKDSTSVEKPKILAVFSFLEQLFISLDAIANTKLDFIIIYYLGINDREISQAAGRLLRWRSGSFVQNELLKTYIWDIIFLLQDSSDPIKINNGFVFWLRYLTNIRNSNIMEDSFLQDLFQKEVYWSYLQKGLISNLHEHRKFCISALQLSIRSLNTNFENSLMKWATDEAEIYLESWKRFITLFEIIGIDTSLNQAQEASAEMVSLLSHDSKVPVPFTLSLLSIGFKASMETVRKFAMQLVFAIPAKNLVLLRKDGYLFLKESFLKFAMMAQNFAVVRDYSDSDVYYKCEFAEKLCQFIVNCFQGLDKASVLQLSKVLIDLLAENRELFDASKIYIALGLLRGLQQRNFKVLDYELLSTLSKYFESHCDGEVMSTTAQTINLRLMLFADPEKVSILQFFHILSMFIHFNSGDIASSNGYTIYNLNLDFFIDYFVMYYTSEELLAYVKNGATSSGMDVDTLTLLLSILLNKNTVADMVPLVLSYTGGVNELLVNMARTKISSFEELLNDTLIRSKIESLVSELLSSDLDLPQLYTNGSALAYLENVFDNMSWDALNISVLWDAVVLDVAANDEAVLRLGISKMNFLADLIDRAIFNSSCESTITFESLSVLQRAAFLNQPTRISKNFYKSKDLFYRDFYRVVKSFSKTIDLKELSNRQKLYALIEGDIEKVAAQSQLFVIKLLSSVFDVIEMDIATEESLTVLGFAKTIWEDIDTHRLILSQKELHLEYIKLLFHTANLNNSKDDGQILSIMEHLSSEIISRLFSRKSLLPTLMKSIVKYQQDYPEEFESTVWLSHVVARTAALLQSNNNVFLIDQIVGDEFDKSLSLYYGEKLYFKSHGDEEVSYRVNIMFLLGSLKDKSEFAEELWNFILTNESEFHLFKPLNRADGYEEWTRIQLLSLLLLTVRSLPSLFIFEKVSKQLLDLIFIEPSPSCRVYVEWITAYALFKAESSQRELIFARFETAILKQHQSIIKSFERICYLFAQQLSQEEESEFLSRFIVDTLLPSCTSNRSLIRHFSVSLVVSVYPLIEKRKLQLEKSLVAALLTIHQNAMRTENYLQYRSGDALLWDVKTDFNLVAISGGVLLRISDHEIDFVAEKYFHKYSTPKHLQMLRVDIGHDEKDLFLSYELRLQKPVMDSFLVNLTEEEIDKSCTTVLQTKSGAWATVMELDEASQVKRSPLIVIASLVDKIVNLGAICRLCDCLGVGLMTLNDIKVAKHPQFKTVAVTAEQWMPMVQVAMDEIIEFMRSQKKQGYTLIGLEQTDQSVQLNSEFQFPEKSLILLGKEREGIPGDLLAELDLCLEIKQNGVIRSMNIQTATAVICHSYSIQHS